MEVSNIFDKFEKKYQDYLLLSPKIEVNKKKICELKEELDEIEKKIYLKNTFMFLKLTDEIDIKNKYIKTLDAEIEEFKDLITNFPKTVNVMMSDFKKENAELLRENVKKRRKFYFKGFSISIGFVIAGTVLFSRKRL
jgi:hypothetical protein